MHMILVLALVAGADLSVRSETAGATADDVVPSVQIDGVSRELRSGRSSARGPALATVSRRRLPVPIEQLSRQFVHQDLLNRWLPSPVSGDFRVGGTWQMEGNAGGTVLLAEPPTRFRVSWIYLGHPSELEVRLGSTGDGGTVVEIEHLMTEQDTLASGMSVQDGLVAAGSGWDHVLDLLERHLVGKPRPSSSDAGAAADDKAAAHTYQARAAAWHDLVRANVGQPR